MKAAKVQAVGVNKCPSNGSADLLHIQQCLLTAEVNDGNQECMYMHCLAPVDQIFARKQICEARHHEQ